MAWLIGLGIVAFLCYAFPTFRVIILVIGGIAVLGISWLLYDSNQQQQVAKTLIPSNQIELINLKLGSYRITGEVKNNSQHTLTGVDLLVKAYDCPSSAITTECITIGEDKVSFFATVPPSQLRAVDSSVYWSNLPSIKGVFLWSYDVTDTTGR
jgi:hypothetical protein